MERLFAEALDIEGGARGEMAKTFERLGGADEPAGAAADHFTGWADGEAAAGGTVRRWGPGLGAAGGVGDDADDLGDDVAGALENDGVAGANVFAGDLVLVGAASRG